MQIVAVHAGVFVAVVQLLSAGSSEPVSVEVHPHDIRTPVPLWAGSEPRPAGSGVVWERFSALAMRAMCYYLDRAKISGERHPGTTHHNICASELRMNDFLYVCATWFW